jgi:hypothetical protein
MMTSHNSADSPNRQPAAVADRNTRSAGGAASVEIAGFPQALYLRRKVDADAAESLIHTVRGAGYRIGASAAPIGH